jgi:type IV pilus assembly protein PilM
VAQTIIGLDIGNYSVKALRLEGGYRTFTVLGYDEEILDTVHVDIGAVTDGEGEVTEAELEDAIHDAEDAALHAALTQLRERGSLDGDHFVVAIPPDLVLAATMAFPFTESKALSAVIPLNFEERIPVSVEELILDHFVVGPSASTPGQHDVTVVAVKYDDLSVFLDLWRASDVDPHHVVMGDAAMANLANYLLEDLTEPFAIIDMGHRFTRVGCFEPREEQPHGVGYVRSFQNGGHEVTQSLMRTFDCTYQQAEHYKHTRGKVAVDTITMGAAAVKASDAMKRGLDASVRELRRTFQAHATNRRNPVTRVFLCGGASQLGNLAPYLAAELGVPAEALPMASEELAAVEREAGSDAVMAQALALGLRDALPVEKRLPINFRTGRFRHQQAQSWVRERAVGVIVLAALFLCALGSVIGTHYMAVSERHDAAKAAMEKGSVQLFGEKVSDVAAVKKRLAGDDGGASLLPTRSAYDHYYAVYSLVPSGLELRFLDVEVDLFRQIIKVTAETDSAASVDAFVDKLQEDDCFKGQVQKGATNAIGEQVKFDLTINPKCADQRKAETKGKK